MNKDLSSEYGQIKIHRKVILEIAELTARQIPGVKKVGLECYGLLGKILELIPNIGTRVKFGTNKEVKISIPLIVEYETNIVDVAYEIQKKVATKLLNTLNIDSLSVDIRIKRIEGR